MGRLSALILQAVCLAGWHTERQADAFVIAANRQDRRAASTGQLSFHKRSSGPLTFSTSCPQVLNTKVIGGKKIISQVGEVVDQLPPTIPLPVYVTRA